MGHSRRSSRRLFSMVAATMLGAGSLLAAVGLPGGAAAAGLATVGLPTVGLPAVGPGPGFAHATGTRVGRVVPGRDGAPISAGRGTAFGVPNRTLGAAASLRALRRPGATVPARTHLSHWLPRRATASAAAAPLPTARASSAAASATVTSAPLAAAPAVTSGEPGLRSDFGTFGLSDADDSLLYQNCSVFELCEEPPDPSIAASTTSVVQTVNELVFVMDRQTGASRVIPNFNFFSLDNNQVNQTDPRILFDMARKRWLATEISADCDHSYLHIAVSSSADPFAAWTVYRIVFPGRVVDFPGIGTADGTVIVSLNSFAADPESTDCLAAGEFEGAMLVVADWSDLEQTVASLPVTTTGPTPDLFTWRPATSAGGDSLGRLIVGIDTGSDTSADVGYATVSGTNAARNVTVSPVVNLTKEQGLAPFAQPPQPRQPGSPATIVHAVDGDPTDAISASGRLWFIATAPCTPAADTASRACVRLTELGIGASPTAVSVTSDIRFEEQGADLYMGGVGRSLDGTLFVTYTRSSRTERITAYATWRRATDGAFHDRTLLVPGGGDYSGERWGDYVILAPDPAQADAVWQSNQVANVDESWFTWLSRIRPAPAGPLNGSFTLDAGDEFAGETTVDLRLTNPPDVAHDRRPGGEQTRARQGWPACWRADPAGLRRSSLVPRHRPGQGRRTGRRIPRLHAVGRRTRNLGPGRDRLHRARHRGADHGRRQRARHRDHDAHEDGRRPLSSSPGAPDRTAAAASRATTSISGRMAATGSSSRRRARRGRAGWCPAATATSGASAHSTVSAIHPPGLSGRRCASTSSTTPPRPWSTAVAGAARRPLRRIGAASIRRGAPGREVSTTFTGRGFAVVGTAGPSLGAIQVFVDGRFAGTFNEARPPAGASRIGFVQALPGTGPPHDPARRARCTADRSRRDHPAALMAAPATAAGRVPGSP